jgi:hypothetical protein
MTLHAKGGKPGQMKTKRPYWIGLFCVAVAGVLAFIPLQFLESDEASLAFACVVLIATLILIGLAIASRNLVGVAIVAAYIVIALALLANNAYPLRERVRWAAFASQYKAHVVASHPQQRRQLPHAVWDAWGWTGMDTFVYLVFDPNDSLLPASRLKSPGKPPGIPCAVYSVHQMEPHWYSVHYYTSKEWDSCSE